jgi:hypothetical protein
MPEKVEEVEDASFLDSLLILQGESNYAPWLHFLRGDERRLSELHKVEHFVNPERAASSENTPPTCT